MKTIYFNIIGLLLLSMSCKAQSPIVPIDNKYKDTPLGGYFKDLNNELDKFTGTWLFTNGNTSFKIKIDKKTMFFEGEYYEDILVGEYQYVEDGIELINTIPQLLQNPDDVFNRNIGGRYIISINQVVACEDCLPNERRLKLYISDPERSYLSISLVLRYLLDESNPEKMTATVVASDSVILPHEDSPQSLRVPYGEYLMVKQ